MTKGLVMNFIKEHVQTIRYRSDEVSTFNELLTKLSELKVEIESADQRSGRIVVHRLTRLVNAVVWRCWSDTLVFQIKRVEGGQADVYVYAIPNFLKLHVKENETVTDLERLLSDLGRATT